MGARQELKNRDMKRVIFVGMHNKVDTPPLSIHTKSGRLIDTVISSVMKQGCLDWGYLKTNLYDIDYLPITKEHKERLARNWHHRIGTDRKNDLIILLGGEVQKNFIVLGRRFSNYAHPSSVWSKAKQKDYIFRMSREIVEFSNGCETKKEK